MILYYSATGNCEYAAKYVAEKVGDKAVNTVGFEKEITLKKDEALGLVFPVYFWGLPAFIEDFLQKVSIKTNGDNYIYCLATYGGTFGKIEYFVNGFLKGKSLKLNACFGVKTVDNWTVSFPVTDKEKIAEALKSEGEQLKTVAEQIVKKEAFFYKKDKKSKFMCNMARKYYNKDRKCTHLNVNDSCIACGLCARNCPEGAIEIKKGKAHFVKESCSICFKCLHRCPQNAINYGNKTQGKGQYTHP